MIILPEKEDIELRIKCFELAIDLSKDDSIYTILIRAREIYKFLLQDNDAEIDAVIEHYQANKWRFNQYSLRE